MLNEDEINKINKNLAIFYTANQINVLGIEEVMKQIDVNEDPEIRGYFRQLINEAKDFVGHKET